jgi:hypothetical protein
LFSVSVPLFLVLFVPSFLFTSLISSQDYSPRVFLSVYAADKAFSKKIPEAFQEGVHRKN